jgi:uncharacterized protein
VRLNLRELPDGITAIEVAKPDGSPDLPGFGDIAGRLTLDKNGGVLRVTGRISFACRLECSRCLGPFELRGREPVELFFRQRQPEDTGPVRERELKPDDLSVLTYRGPEIDLWPAIRETLELARPLKPLCRPDCRGICNGCGRDLNREPCVCRPRGGDPRWEALRPLAPEPGSGPRPRRKRAGDGG